MPLQGDILMVIDEQELAGQTILNVYHYELQDDVADYDGIADQLEQQLIDDVANIQSTSLEHIKLTIKNLTDGVGLKEVTYSTPITGLRAGEYMPSFVAWAFRMNRTNQTTRNGQKRIAGVAEGDCVGNLPVAGFVTSLNAVATTLGDPILFGTGQEISPVIVRKTALGVVQQVNPVLNTTFSRVSSQVSRKQY